MTDDIPSNLVTVTLPEMKIPAGHKVELTIKNTTSTEGPPRSTSQEEGSSIEVPGAPPPHPGASPFPPMVPRGDFTRGEQAYVDQTLRHKGNIERAPAVLKGGTRGTVNLYDMGARGIDRDADSAAMAKAVTEVNDGGKIFIPYGSWLVSGVSAPPEKSIVFEGETELGAELCGAPGQDILRWEDRPEPLYDKSTVIVRNLAFRLRGSGLPGYFKRGIDFGGRVGAACLAWEYSGQHPVERSGFALTVENCFASRDAGTMGAAFVYSDRYFRSLRFHNVDPATLQFNIVMGGSSTHEPVFDGERPGTWGRSK